MINPRVQSLQKSSTLKITALTKKLKKEGKDVVNFAAGEPDFDTPSFIKEAAKKAIDNGFTKYTPSAGMVELREAIAHKLNSENKISCGPNNIIVTSGAKYALFAAIFTLLDEKDEILLPAPYWVSYPEMIKLTGATLKIINCKKENNFKLQKEELKKALTNKTKLLILNYPSNPSGITYLAQELKEFYEIIKDRNIFVLSDEIYEKLIYDEIDHVSFASLSGAYKTTVTVNGFSKSFSMTGWRLGYLAADEEVIAQASKIIDHTTSCASSISQAAGLAALQYGRGWEEKIRKEFQYRRDILWEGLNKSSELTPIRSQGTFYMFCDISKTGLSSFDFASRLLEKQLVSVIPGDAFGAEGFVRFSFATSQEQIHKGIERIRDFLQEL